MRGIICAAKARSGVRDRRGRGISAAGSARFGVYVNLGNVHLGRGDVEAAAELFSDAVALDPGADAARTALRTMSR
jgi:Tetratricopeptide repeat